MNATIKRDRMKKVKKILLMQPNFRIFGKRSWNMPPYNLAILNACLKSNYEVQIFDPNFNSLSEAEIRSELRNLQPDLVGITSFSTEYITEFHYYCAMVKEELPEAVVVVGGIIPTVMIETVIHDPAVDFFVIGEGELRLRLLLDLLNSSSSDYSVLDGIAYRTPDGASHIQPPLSYIQDLDSVPFPDYGNLDIVEYGNAVVKRGLLPRHYPYAVTITSRGCPYRCVFCAAATVSGRKVRMRSAENVLNEIDWLCNEFGIREIFFLDDHFLYRKERAIEIMSGIMSRHPGITWKSANTAIFSLDREILELMRESGCYQFTVSIESGDENVLKKIIKKPVNLKKAKIIIDQAKTLGFEIISNFVFGFPGETWDSIRRTIAYAEDLDIDLVNFHIATPLPKTELMDICLREAIIKSEDDGLGYTKGVISTKEFSGFELQVLRAFEWDRINFKTPDKIARIASMEGLTLMEVSEWRSQTRRQLGTAHNWKD